MVGSLAGRAGQKAGAGRLSYLHAELSVHLMYARFCWGAHSSGTERVGVSTLSSVFPEVLGDHVVPGIELWPPASKACSQPLKLSL